MGFVIPLLFILCSNTTMVLLTKKTFGKCLPITLMLSTFSLYFSQFIFKTFNVGIIIDLIFSLIFIVLLIKSRKNAKLMAEYKKNLFTNGFYAFLTMYILVFILDFNRTLSMWDEKSHWGVMIKEMLRLDNFYSIKSSTLLVHKDYPPLLQIFELFWTKLSLSYKEAYLIRALHVFEFSLFIPAIAENIKKKSSKFKVIFNTIGIMGIIFLMILLFDQHNIANCIYNDYFMAILVAYGICLVVFEKNTLSNFNLISLSIIGSFLLLTKQMGLPLYLIIIFIFIFDLILKNHKNIKHLLNKKNILYAVKILCLVIIIPLFLWKGWNNYIENLHIEQQFKLSELKIAKLPAIMKGTYGEKWQNTASINYTEAVKSRNLTTSNFINLSYLQALVLFLILLYLIWLIGKKHFYKRQVPLIGITVIIGSIGYSIVMLVMYVFTFGSREGVTVASYDRYMDTYLIIAFSVIIMLYIWIKSQEEKNNYNSLLLCSTLFLIQSPKMTTCVYPKLLHNIPDDYEYSASLITKKVEKKAKVFIIAPNTSGEYQFYVKYYANPIITNLDYFSFPLDDETNYKEFYEKNILKYMSKYDYVYIASITDELIDKYSFVFPNKNIKVHQLYRINKEKNDIKLSLIK